MARSITRMGIPSRFTTNPNTVANQDFVPNPGPGVQPAALSSNNQPSPTPPQSLYFQQVNTPQGPVKVAYTRNAMGQYKPQAVVGNDLFELPVNQTQNGVTEKGTVALKYVVSGSQLVPQTVGSNIYVYTSVGGQPQQVATISGSTITPTKTPIAEPITSGGQNYGTLYFMPTLGPNNTISLQYSGFKGSTVNIQGSEQVTVPVIMQSQPPAPPKIYKGETFQEMLHAFNAYQVELKYYKPYEYVQYETKTVGYQYPGQTSYNPTTNQITVTPNNAFNGGTQSLSLANYFQGNQTFIGPTGTSLTYNLVLNVNKGTATTNNISSSSPVSIPGLSTKAVVVTNYGSNPYYSITNPSGTYTAGGVTAQGTLSLASNNGKEVVQFNPSNYSFTTGGSVVTLTNVNSAQLLALGFGFTAPGGTLTETLDKTKGTISYSYSLGGSSSTPASQAFSLSGPNGVFFFPVNNPGYTGKSNTTQLVSIPQGTSQTTLTQATPKGSALNPTNLVSISNQQKDLTVSNQQQVSNTLSYSTPFQSTNNADFTNIKPSGVSYFSANPNQNAYGPTNPTQAVDWSNILHPQRGSSAIYNFEVDVKQSATNLSNLFFNNVYQPTFVRLIPSQPTSNAIGIQIEYGTLMFSGSLIVSLVSIPTSVVGLVTHPGYTASSTVSYAKGLPSAFAKNPVGTVASLGGNIASGFVLTEGAKFLGPTEPTNVKITTFSTIDKNGQLVDVGTTLNGASDKVTLVDTTPGAGRDVVPSTPDAAAKGPTGLDITGTGRGLSQGMSGTTYATFDIGRFFKRSFVAVSRTEGAGVTTIGRSVTFNDAGATVDLYEFNRDTGTIGAPVKRGVVSPNAYVSIGQSINKVGNIYQEGFDAFPSENTQVTKYYGDSKTPAGQPFRYVAGEGSVTSASIAKQSSNLPAVSKLDILQNQATDATPTTELNIDIKRTNAIGEGYSTTGQVNGKTVVVSKGFGRMEGINGPIKFTNYATYADNPSGLASGSDNLPAVFKQNGRTFGFSTSVVGAIAKNAGQMGMLTSIYPLTALGMGSGPAYFAPGVFGTFTGALGNAPEGGVSNGGTYSVTSTTGSGEVQVQKVIQPTQSTQQQVPGTTTTSTETATTTKSVTSTTKSISLTGLDPLITNAFRYSQTGLFGVGMASGLGGLASTRMGYQSSQANRNAPLLTTNPYLTRYGSKTLTAVAQLTSSKTKTKTSTKTQTQTPPPQETFPTPPGIPNIPIGDINPFHQKPKEQRSKLSFHYKPPSFKYVADFTHASLHIFGKKTNIGLSRPLIAPSKRRRRR